MMKRVIGIVFLFLIHFRLLFNLSAIQVIRNCYGNDTVKLKRQFKKLDYKYCKLLLDLSFLESCIKIMLDGSSCNLPWLIEICQNLLHISNVKRN